MIRIVGAALVTLAASLVGFGFARGVRRQCAQLEGLLWALDYMQSEMSARLTPLPQIFSLLSACPQRDVAMFFAAAGQALSVPPGCTVPVSFKRGFHAAPALCVGQDCIQSLYALAMGLGRFELEAQLAAIERAKACITSVLLQLQAQKRARCRSYETLGICAGLALAVILL